VQGDQLDIFNRFHLLYLSTLYDFHIHLTDISSPRVISDIMDNLDIYRLSSASMCLCRYQIHIVYHLPVPSHMDCNYDKHHQSRVPNVHYKFQYSMLSCRLGFFSRMMDKPRMYRLWSISLSVSIYLQHILYVMVLLSILDNRHIHIRVLS